MKKMQVMDDLFMHELKDMLHAEKQMVGALPKIAKKASSGEARSMMEQHRKETEEQVKRLERVFEILGASPRAQRCKGMEGIIEEAEELLKGEGEPNVMDAGIISLAQKMEHYEIAGYGTLVTWAEMMGNNEVTDLLKQNLDEEEQTDQKLTRLAKEEINRKAIEAE